MPACPLMALSGHWFGRRVCPLLGVKQTSLFRDRGPLMTREFELEENRHVFLIRPSLLRIVVSLLLELGRTPSKPLRCKGLLLGCEGIVPAIGPNHPAIPQIAGRDGLASDCQHSHDKSLDIAQFSCFHETAKFTPELPPECDPSHSFYAAETLLLRRILAPLGREKVSRAAFGGQHSVPR